MRRIAAIAVFAGLLSARSLSPDLASVNKIYLLQMSGGLDQYLANRLTRESRFVVSTDPKNADAVMTDHLGPSFESRYNELYPPPEPPAPPKDTAKDKDSKKKDDDTPGFKTPKEEVRFSSFGRGRGNVFLVDKATRRVLWSYYRKPKSSGSEALNKVADHVIDQLVKD